ncbi:hypothetical protein ACTZGP_13455, partial [Pseudomonas putida]|uniref:hypothetical protein n=1 Tax=Pseudomonas putida TaxID=303 RepID=UPI003FD1F5D6
RTVGYFQLPQRLWGREARGLNKHAEDSRVVGGKEDAGSYLGAGGERWLLSEITGKDVFAMNGREP